jgi:hypothetical protein
VALKNLTKYEENEAEVLENPELVKQLSKCTIYECFFCHVVRDFHLHPLNSPQSSLSSASQAKSSTKPTIVP